MAVGYGRDRAWPALRLNSQKGGLKFDHFPIGPFGSEKCSWQLLESGVETKMPELDHLELENSLKKSLTLRAEKRSV